MAKRSVRVQVFGDVAPCGSFCCPMDHAAVSESMCQLAMDMPDADLRVANWEAPLWGDGGVNALKHPRVCTTAEAAACLLPLGFDCVSLANNHAYDCLASGFRRTVDFFVEHGVTCVGGGNSIAQAAEPVVLDRTGRTIGILSYVAADTNPNIPPDAEIAVNVLDETRAIEDVGTLATRVDHVIVVLHWGDECVPYPNPTQRTLARCIIEAGAALVVGHHAHCLQGHERWGRGHIFYGLGNFLFGEVGGRSWPLLYCRGGVADVIIGPAGIESARLIYTLQEGHALRVDDRSSRRRHGARLCAPFQLSPSRYERFWRKQRRFHQGLVCPLALRYRASGLRGLAALLTQDRLTRFAGALFRVRPR